MSRVSSLVMVRVAAEVALLTTFSRAEVFDLVFLPLTLSLTQVLKMVAKTDVTAVMTVFITLLIMPGFLFSSFSSFFLSASSS